MSHIPLLALKAFTTARNCKSWLQPTDSILQKGRNCVLDEDVIAIKIQTIDSHIVLLMAWMHQSLMSLLAACEKENCPSISNISCPGTRQGSWRDCPSQSTWRAVVMWRQKRILLTPTAKKTQNKTQEELMFKSFLEAKDPFQHPQAFWVKRPWISVSRSCSCWSSVIQKKNTSIYTSESQSEALKLKIYRGCGVNSCTHLLCVARHSSVFVIVLLLRAALVKTELNWHGLASFIP